MSAPAVWGAIVLAGVGTYLIRASFLAAAHRLSDVPEGVARVLRMIPPAALAALTAPAVLRPDGGLDPWSSRLAAAAIAALVGHRTSNMAATLGAGFATLIVLDLIG